MNSSSTAVHTVALDSPVGQLTIVASDRGVRAVLWPGDDCARVPSLDPLAAEPEPPGQADRTGAAAIAHSAASQLSEYFAGERTDFDVPLDPIGTDFQRAAWGALRTIPYGESVSYGEQAERMGERSKARAVGAANGRNPISIIVPCHRVVGADGSLTGFAGGIDTKRYLLDLERRVSGRTLL